MGGLLFFVMSVEGNRYMLLSMNLSSALLSCCLLLVSCSQLPLANSEGATPASELAVETGQPEVRFYMISDT